MSKRYKVLTPFVTFEGFFTTKGEVVTNQSVLVEQVESMVKHGFIEELPENTRWRAAEDAEKFYYVKSNGIDLGVQSAFDMGDIGWGYSTWQYGNYFKTQETAEKVAEALRLFFEWLHEVPDNNNIGKWGDLVNSYHHARDAVLQDDKGLDLGE